MSDAMTENKDKFFSYKGYPLVRKGDEIYYGNMYDSTVIMMQILEKTKVGSLEVASRIRIYQMISSALQPYSAAIALRRAVQSGSG